MSDPKGNPLPLLKCTSYTELNAILDLLFEPRWIDNYNDVNDLYANISQADKVKLLTEQSKTVDFNTDFDIYNPDFIRYFGIDLRSTDISFIEFQELFSAICSYDDSQMRKVIGYRTFEVKNKMDRNYVKYMKQMQHKYKI